MNAKFFKYSSFLLLFLGGCYNYNQEAVKVEALKVVPEHIEIYYVEVDDYIYLPGMDMDGNFEMKKHRTGSHPERRERLIPETYFLTFSCQHGMFTESTYTQEYPTLASIKKDFPYLIRFGTNRVLGVTHKYLWQDLQQRKTLEGK